MSRLIVKNLPPKITEDKLRQTFSTHGYVTDIQLKYTKDGKFRHFGFVGFQKEEDAEKAATYFNNTFIGASKVQVQISADIGSDQKPRAWSKYATDSSAFQGVKGDEEQEEKKVEKPKKVSKKEKKKQVEALMDKYKDDPKFQEFLSLHKRNYTEKWNSDAILEVGKTYEPKGDEGFHEKSDEEEAKIKEDKISDLDFLQSLVVDGTKPKKDSETEETKPEENKVAAKEIHFNVKLSGLPYKAKKKDVKAFFAPLKPKSVRVPPKIKGIAYAGFATEKDQKQALNKNKSFMNGRQIFVHKVASDLQKDTQAPWKEKEEELKSEETVSESGRIFVRNLSYTVTEDDIETLFKKFGPLTEVNVPIDRLTRKVKGFAFVTFMMPEHAMTAFKELDGSTFQGRLLHLIPGKSKPIPEDTDSSGAGSSFKQKKEQKQKAQAGSSHNWNTLFIDPSAVADLMSDKYGVSKQDILTGDGQNSAAVRLALGETQIVSDTRAFLEEQGVSVDSFEAPAKARSKTVILVKNLPARTPVENIRDLFSKHGELSRIVLPPHCITALVEFYEPSEAKKAFRALAYTKFRNTPLYLEWAPEDAFKSGPGEKKEEQEKEEEVEKEPEVADDVEPEPGTTLFVKNLNFDTTENALRDHFKSVGPLHSVSVAMKKDAKYGTMLSMGYGFVQFKLTASAEKALKTLQHRMLDGHSLELKRSNRTDTNQVQTAKKSSAANGEKSSKIHVKNIPFQANEKEISDLFRTFGELKFVRLPKKVAGTGSHRGFGFVEFISKVDAEKAFQSLCHSTHLYGRRLVLEWASQEETIEDLRKRTAAHFVDGSKAKRSRTAVEDTLLGGKPNENE